MKFLLDTDTLIYISKRMGNCVANLEQHLDSDIAISTISLFELEFGIAKSNNPAKGQAFLHEIKDRFSLLVFDEISGAHAGKLRAQLSLIGMPIGPYDLQHAAIALTHSLTFITRNTNEFLRVPSLQFANWYD
jgi:tRNA(fMet)-specific endonuclease VapC